MSLGIDFNYNLDSSNKKEENKFVFLSIFSELSNSTTFYNLGLGF